MDLRRLRRDVTALQARIKPRRALSFVEVEMHESERFYAKTRRDLAELLAWQLDRVRRRDLAARLRACDDDELTSVMDEARAALSEASPGLTEAQRRLATRRDAEIYMRWVAYHFRAIARDADRQGLVGAARQDFVWQEYQRLVCRGSLPALPDEHPVPGDAPQAPGTNDEADVPSLVSKKCLAEYLAAVDLAVGPLEDKGTLPAEPEGTPADGDAGLGDTVGADRGSS